MRNYKLIREVKNLAKNRYTSLGCYPLFLVMADGACLCADCTKSEFSQIGRATRDSLRDGWTAAAVAVNYESDITCDHCGEQIESAYGPVSDSEM